MESGELGSPVQVTLFAPRVSLGDISAGLKCVADPSSSSLEGEVVENGVGVFSISVTPGVRGRHDLTVKVRGEEIEGRAPSECSSNSLSLNWGKKIRLVGLRACGFHGE